MRREALLTKRITEILSQPAHPKYRGLWQALDEPPVAPCPRELKKKGGAKSDACFMEPGKTCLLLENKASGAPLQLRQFLFYLNEFCHFYANHRIHFQQHKFIFLTDKKSRYSDRLKRLFSTTYTLPEIVLKRTHLSRVELLGAVDDSSNISYSFIATYKGIDFFPTVMVKIIPLDLSLLEEAG